MSYGRCLSIDFKALDTSPHDMPQHFHFLFVNDSLCQSAFRATFQGMMRVEMNTNSAGVEEEWLRLLPGITCLACCELLFLKAWNQTKMANLKFVWKVSVNLLYGFGTILISCLSVTYFASWPSELPSELWIMMWVDMNTNLTSADVEYGQRDSVGMLWSFVSKSLKSNEDSQSGTSHLRSLSTDFKALETSWPCRINLTFPASMIFKLHIGCLPMRSAVTSWGGQVRDRLQGFQTRDLSPSCKILHLPPESLFQYFDHFTRAT